MKAILFYLFYSIAWFISILPFRLLYLFSDFLFVLVFYIIKYRKKVAIENLKNSFPEKSHEEIMSICKKFYRYFCDFIVENIKSFTISEKELEKRMQIKNGEYFSEAFEKGKNIIFVSGHYGNWEWTIRLPKEFEHKMLVLYHPLENKYFDRLITKTRTKYGAVMVPMKETYNIVLEHYRNNILTATWFIADQRPRKTYPFWTTFLNQETAVYLGAEKLARKTNAVFLFMNVKKIRRGYYITELTKLYDDSSKTTEHEITLAHTKLLEKIIKETPEYWLWTHKRWKHKRTTQELY